MMDEYLPLSHFKAVYIVDLCHSLCEQVGAQHCFTFYHRCCRGQGHCGVSVLLFNLDWCWDLESAAVPTLPAIVDSLHCQTAPP
jgi:hypothetical protein